jgi:hypothetical protein
MILSPKQRFEEFVKGLALNQVKEIELSLLDLKTLMGTITVLDQLS